jgi:hypothetical protein
MVDQSERESSETRLDPELELSAEDHFVLLAAVAEDVGAAGVHRAAVGR